MADSCICDTKLITQNLGVPKNLAYLILVKIQIRKPSFTNCDLYDVTLGNPAISQKQDTLKEAQRGISRPVAFRPHVTMGLAL